ncbi:hypothetical protein K1719_019114 [Acacia pycnantha]|nr:hypothetical protein K1719_019114 [Acacia pycnantha]
MGFLLPKFRLLYCTEFSPDMSSIVRHVSSLLRQPLRTVEPLGNGCNQLQQLQQCRGIRVMVENGELERALAFMQRTMQSSGMERMIKQVQRHHIKNSEKRVLARKKLELKIKSQDLARKLKAILLKKVRGLLLEKAAATEFMEFDDDIIWLDIHQCNTIVNDAFIFIGRSPSRGINTLTLLTALARKAREIKEGKKIILLGVEYVTVLIHEFIPAIFKVSVF